MLFTVGEPNNTSSNYYENRYMQTSVNSTLKKEYLVKKGDSLWEISKRHLNDKEATNAEIQDMMYKIAKLNKINSVDAANSLKVDDIIYLPDVESPRLSRCEVKNWFLAPKLKHKAEQRLSPQKLAKVAADKINKYIVPEGSDFSRSQRQIYKLNNLDNVPKELYKEHAVAGIKCWNEYLSNPDNSLKITKGNLSLSNVKGAIHIVKKSSDKYDATTVASMYVVADKNGKIREITFNSPELRINNIAFDYQVNRDGSLSKITNGGVSSYSLASLSNEDYEVLVSNLQKLLDERID